jgi:hypothetical protein
MDETTFRLDSHVEELAGVLPEELEEVLEEELGAIVHAPDYRCYEVRKGGSLGRSRFVGFDMEGAGCLIELRNVERDRWTITVKTEGEA